jgi:ATP-dependent Clp protease protease subunit
MVTGKAKPKKAVVNPVWIRFMSQVNQQSITTLFKSVDQAVAQGHNHIHLMLSSPGGSVFHGLSAHNYLRGLGLPLTTYNFGMVDSIGVILFCSGAERICVPHARFLIHQVTTQFGAGTILDEKGIEETLKSNRIDTANIAKVISDCTAKPLKEVEDHMKDRTTLNPTEAKAYGLVTKIQKDMYKSGALIAIYEDGAVHNFSQIQMNLTQVPMHYSSMPLNSTYHPVQSMIEEQAI